MFKSINLHTYVGNNFSCPLWQPKSLNRVIPIVVSPCVWKFDPVIRRLQALPSGSGEGVLPVSEWKNHNLAWASVAQGYCEYCYCHEEFGTGPFNIEHIIPYVFGGSGDIENLALSCSGCNGHKFTKMEAIDPVSEQFVPLFNPRKQLWQEHFFWNESATEIIGSTPTGRATIDALQMNRLPLLNLRKGMVLLGQHPPNNLPIVG